MRSFSTRADAGDGRISLEDLELLTQVAGDLASSLTLDSSWGRFAKNVADLITYDRILLSLFDSEQNVLRNEFESGLTIIGQPTDAEVSLRGSVGGTVVKTGEIVIENSVGPSFVAEFPAAEPLEKPL